jgi:hypothetical protein
LSVLASAIAAWDRFFFAERSAVSLALFRIAFAAALLIELPVSWSRNVSAVSSTAFHLPYLAAIPLIPLGLYHALHLVQAPLILLLGAGIWMRPACLWLLGVQGWIFFADALNFRNHPYLFLWILVLLAISPASSALSLRPGSKRDGSRGIGAGRPITIQRLLQIQICLVYLIAGVQKIHPHYFSGEVIALHHRELEPLRDWLLGGVLGREALQALQRFLAAPSTWVLPSYLTVAAELGLPLALWWPRVRPAAIAVGVAFHVAIALSLGIYEFSIVMTASYLLFLDPDAVGRWLLLRQSRKAQRRRRLAASSRSGGGTA